MKTFDLLDVISLQISLEQHKALVLWSVWCHGRSRKNKLDKKHRGLTASHGLFMFFEKEVFLWGTAGLVCAPESSDAAAEFVDYTQWWSDSTVHNLPVFIFTHMYPAQGDEIVLVLYEEEFLLIFCVTIVRPTALLWYYDVGHGKRISGLKQTQEASRHYIPLNYAKPPSAKKLTKDSAWIKLTEHWLVCCWQKRSVMLTGKDERSSSEPDQQTK